MPKREKVSAGPASVSSIAAGRLLFMGLFLSQVQYWLHPYPSTRLLQPFRDFSVNIKLKYATFFKHKFC